MEKNIIKTFFLLLCLFLLYHFFYIFNNQSSTINSDTLWSYSFSRDVIEGVDLKNFSFPPFYYFLDIIISFIPSLPGNHLLHSMLVSPVNICIFLFFFSRFYSSDYDFNFYKNGSLLILSIILIYFLFIAISYFFSLIFQSVFPLVMLKNYFFMQGNHGLSSVAALIISYNFYFRSQKFKNNLFLFILVFIFSFSDFWFAVYFLPIIGFFYLFKKDLKILINLIYLTLVSSSALLATYFFNSELSSYKLTHNNSFDTIVGIKSIFFILYILPISFFIYLYFKQSLTLFLRCVMFASFVSFAFIFFTNNYSYLNMRFYVFFLPLNILLIFEILKIHFNQIKKIFFISILLLFLGISQLFTFNLTNNIMKNEFTHFNFEEEISCIKEITDKKNYTVMTDYWPGKIVFESLNRKINLISTNWIYNPSWSNLNKNANGLIIVTYKLYPDGNMHDDLKNLIESKKSDSKMICNNKLILIDNLKVSRN